MNGRPYCRQSEPSSRMSGLEYPVFGPCRASSVIPPNPQNQLSRPLLSGVSNFFPLISTDRKVSTIIFMSMATLNIASKANQATFLPALLIATYVIEIDPNVSININYHEVDNFKSGDAAAVELALGTDSPVYGSEKAAYKLLEAYPVLRGKNEDLVSSCSDALVPSNLNAL